MEVIVSLLPLICIFVWPWKTFATDNTRQEKNKTRKETNTIGRKRKRRQGSSKGGAIRHPKLRRATPGGFPLVRPV